jgi:hypothetical protein
MKKLLFVLLIEFIVYCSYAQFQNLGYNGCLEIEVNYLYQLNDSTEFLYNIKLGI